MAAVADRGVGRVFRSRQGRKTGRQLRHPIAVTHPDRKGIGQALKQRRGGLLMQDGGTVLPLVPRGHLPAQLMRQSLHPVADA